MSNIGYKPLYWLSVAFLTLFAIIWCLPLIFMVSLSFQSDENLIVSTAHFALGLLPWPFTPENYVSLLGFDETPRWFLNSFIVSVVSTLTVLVISASAGYAFARIDFAGRRFVFAFVLAGMMIPGEGVFISLYTMFADWQAHSTYFSLIAPNLSLPVGTILLTQFFRGISREIEEAAEIDGANRWVIFTRIMLPMSIPALTTLAIITFLWSWNSYLWPLVTAQEREMYTITVGLGSTQQGYTEENTGRIMAQGMIASFPVVFLYLFLQRYLIRGIVVQSK